MTVKKTTVCDVTGAEFDGDNPVDTEKVTVGILFSGRIYDVGSFHVSREYLKEAVEDEDIPHTIDVTVVFSGKKGGANGMLLGEPLGLYRSHGSHGTSKAVTLPASTNDKVEKICRKAEGHIPKERNGMGRGVTK